MKKIGLVLALVCSLFINAQDGIEKQVGEFSIVKVFDLIHLKMMASDENKVIISGKNRNDVEVVNNNGKLKIRMNLRESYDGDDTVVLLYFTSVDEIDANEGAKVTVKETIKQYEIDLRVQEGAEITADLETTYANFRAVTGGIINTTGSSKNQDISIYTGGVFNGEDFITEKTDVSINAAGEAYVHATESANARIKAGGNVYIYGKPKEVEERTILGGKIKRM
ncbi:putative autotransporter adhesin-like protein [Winogradskyella pacifica]|uniref:Putative autotransporter adhesin-like protein n=1 Tax=Winogradskyella pacifica TaxID=664642 RepID=A0A3D9LMK9_9FLAO|nr:head GIN domain-containing protein [Winogradskyella pacifica]REE08505.1 putative autotransporter adhesin-like protein [Winogradskyella pacifica]